MKRNIPQIHKSGEIVNRSGQVEIVGPQGGRTGIERTVVSGEPYPPTLRPGQGFIMVDPTKTK